MIDTGSTEVIGTAGWNTCSRCGEQIVGYRTLCDVCRQHPPSCEGQYTMLYPCMNCAIKDNEIANLQAKLAKAEKVVEAIKLTPHGVECECVVCVALADLDTPNPEEVEGLMDA